MNSRQRLVTAMTELLQHTTIDKITVQQLIQTADVSKGTFYTYFADKFDVMNSYFQDAVKEHMKAAIDEPWVTILEKGNLFLAENQAYFKEAIQSRGQNSFLSFWWQNSLKNVRYGVLTRSGKQAISEADEQAIQFFVAGYTRLTYQWIEQGMKADPIALAQQIYAFMPAQIKTYLW